MKRGVMVFERGRERKRETEIAPADAVCWEQVVYLGQHIASSAFLPNLPEQMEKGPTCSRNCIIKSFCLCAQLACYTCSLTYRTVHTEIYCTYIHKRDFHIYTLFSWDYVNNILNGFSPSKVYVSVIGDFNVCFCCPSSTWLHYIIGSHPVN